MLLAAAAPAQQRQPLTPLTEASGGPIDADQARTRLDRVDLAIELFPERFSISGVATLTLTALEPLDRVAIDLDRGLPVARVEVEGTALPASRWRNPDGRIRIDLPRSYRAGEAVTVTIRYAGKPHIARRAPWDGGFVWSQSADGQPWIATAVQGEGCDLFWPCIDHPAFEAGEITLHLTVPKGLSAPSNGRLLGVDRLDDGRSTWHWRIANPNSYGMAINVGPYRELTAQHRSRFGNQVPMHLWYLPEHAAGAAALFREFGPVLDFFEARIGPYPFADEKLGVVETPHLGMEHQTINAYGNNFARSPDGFDWLFQHELAHEWFANQMTAADWDDFWLHEGYANYMQPLYGEWREGIARYQSMMLAQRLQIAGEKPLVSGRPRAADEVYEAATGPGTDIYYKGAWVLHTLRGLLGDDAFFEITRRLVYGRPDPRPGNFKPRFASTAEFRRIAQQVSGRDLGWFFDVYLDHAALPRLESQREGNRLRLRWQTPGGLPFPMPVEIATNGAVQRVAMTDGQGEVPLPENAHVVIDPAARVLRQSDDVDAYRAWQRGQPSSR